MAERYVTPSCCPQWKLWKVSISPRTSNISIVSKEQSRSLTHSQHVTVVWSSVPGESDCFPMSSLRTQCPLQRFKEAQEQVTQTLPSWRFPKRYSWRDKRRTFLSLSNSVSNSFPESKNPKVRGPKDVKDVKDIEMTCKLSKVALMWLLEMEPPAQKPALKLAVQSARDLLSIQCPNGMSI